MLPPVRPEAPPASACATVPAVERFDAIVVGGGAMGTAAARELANRGRHTLVLERFTFGHANGSSGGPTRIFRYAYHRADYVRLAMSALEAWRDLEDAAGQTLLQVTGGIDIGPPCARAGRPARGGRGARRTHARRRGE